MIAIVIIIIAIITYHRIKYSYERNFGKNEKLFGNGPRPNFDTNMKFVNKRVTIKILDSEFDRIQRILGKHIHYDYFEQVHLIYKGNVGVYVFELTIRNPNNPYLTLEVKANNGVIFISDPFKNLNQEFMLTIYDSVYGVRFNRGL